MGEEFSDTEYEVLVQRERNQNGAEEPDKGKRKLQGAVYMSKCINGFSLGMNLWVISLS